MYKYRAVPIGTHHIPPMTSVFTAILTKFLSTIQNRKCMDQLNYVHFCSQQTGTIRTNCVDCLDRTNAVQCMFALEVGKFTNHTHPALVGWIIKIHYHF